MLSLSTPALCFVRFFDLPPRPSACVVFLRSTVPQPDRRCSTRRILWLAAVEEVVLVTQSPPRGAKPLCEQSQVSNLLTSHTCIISQHVSVLPSLAKSCHLCCESSISCSCTGPNPLRTPYPDLCVVASHAGVTSWSL